MLARDWGTGKIDLRSPPPTMEGRPVELHHKSDGATDGQPSFTFVVLLTGERKIGRVVSQISLAMLTDVLAELGYELKAKP